MWGVWLQTAAPLRQARRLALGAAIAGRPEREAWWRERAEATWGLDRAFVRGATDGPVLAVPARADRFFAPPVLAGILEADGRQIPALVLGAPAALRGLLEDLAAGRPARAIVVDRARIGFLVPVVWDPDKNPARAREILRAAALLPPPPHWLWGLVLRLMAQEWLRTPDWGGAAAAGVATRWAEGAPPGGFPHPGCPGGLFPAPGGWACPACGLELSVS
jgi:hypothetical protein